jgi:hypothetical protein
VIEALADPARATEARLALAKDPEAAREHADAIAALLDAPQPEVREAAAMLLADLGAGPADAIARELAESIRRLPPPGPTQEIALRTVARAERLARVAPLPADVEAIVADLLRFFPSPTPDYYWPQTWVRAARLVDVGELERIATGEERCYLTALGALKLVRAGVRSPLIDGWLREDRDYPFLTDDERAQLGQ